MDNFSSKICNGCNVVDLKDELPQIGYDIIAFIYGLLAVASLCMNGILISLFLNYNCIRKTEHLLILSIAISDWLVALATYPLGAKASLDKNSRLTGAVCSYYACVSTILGLNAMLHFTALSIQKCLVFTRSLRTRMTRRTVVFIIVALWLFSTVWGLFPLFGWSSFAPEAGNIVCSIDWASKDPNNISYIMALFTIFFFFPLIAIFASYFLIFRGIRRMTRHAARSWGSTAQGTKETFNAQLKSIRLAFIMVSGFLFAWTPYSVVSLYSAFSSSDAALPTVVGVLPPLFAKTSTLYNPILCFVGCPAIRKCLFKAINGIRSRRSSLDGRTSTSILFKKSSLKFSHSRPGSKRRRSSDRFAVKEAVVTQHKYDGTTIL